MTPVNAGRGKELQVRRDAERMNASGSGSAYNPAFEGSDFGARHMRKRRGRTRKVRRRRGVNRPGGPPETTREAGWLACIGLGLPDQPVPPSHDPFWWSVWGYQHNSCKIAR